MVMIRQKIKTLDDIDALNRRVKPINGAIDRKGGYKEHIWNKTGISRPFIEKLGTEFVEREEEKPRNNRIERIPKEDKKKKKSKK